MTGLPEESPPSWPQSKFPVYYRTSSFQTFLKRVTSSDHCTITTISVQLEYRSGILYHATDAAKILYTLGAIPCQFGCLFQLRTLDLGITEASIALPMVDPSIPAALLDF